MKFVCDCDATIRDNSDFHPHKAHYITDQELTILVEVADETIENPSFSKKDAINKILDFFSLARRSIYQCTLCGRIYLDDIEYHLQGFVPRNEETTKELFQRWLHPLNKKSDN
jgi:hypothetical protein